MRKKRVNAWHRHGIGAEKLDFVILLGNGVIRLHDHAAKGIAVPPDSDSQPEIIAGVNKRREHQEASRRLQKPPFHRVIVFSRSSPGQSLMTASLALILCEQFLWASAAM